MENEDLIEKLENIELPEIKSDSHKRRLKMALLGSDYFRKPSFIEIIKKSLVFAVPALALFMILGITVIQPRLTEAKVLGIAKNNPEIKKLMEDKNMVLGDIKVKDGRAYVLLNPSQEAESATEKNPAIKIQKTETYAPGDLGGIEGAVIEVNLKEKEVAQINSINSDEIIPLVDEDKESAREIVDAEEIIRDIIPKEAKIEKIQSSLPSKNYLVEKDDEIEVASRIEENEKKARVNYILDGKKWVIKVNLDKKRVEEIQYSSEKIEESDVENKSEENNNEDK